jgi:hypothetical protein
MGSKSVLVIGDDWREQLDRYKTMEYADPLSPHIVHVDILPRELERYLASDTRQNITFIEWAEQCGYVKLDPGVEPDLSGKHRWGWMRLNDAGEVAELVWRTIPDAFFFFFRHTYAEFLLKPGATGWNVDGNGQATEVTEGYAGSARLSDIDFHAMQQKQIDDFQERRDAVLQNIYKAYCTDSCTHEALDPMLLPRADYVRHRAKHGVLDRTDLIRYGQHLDTFNEAELLAELDDDALLTMAYVKC